MPQNAPVNESTARQLEFAFRAAYTGTQNDGTDGSSRGHRFVALIPSEDVLLANYLPPDTSPHPSTNYAVTIYAQQKTFFVVSTLNQACSVQVQWSRDGTNWFNLGGAVSVPAGNVTISGEEIGPSSVSALNDYIPLLRVTVTCATQATSGAISVWLSRLG